MEKVEINRINNIKLLGLTFDQKLTWLPHLKSLKQTYSQQQHKNPSPPQLGSRSRNSYKDLPSTNKKQIGLRINSIQFSQT